MTKVADTVCKQEVFKSQGLSGRKVTADFSGGYLSSDAGGSLLLRELHLKTGLMARLSDCFTDYRNPLLIEHSVLELLSQRIGALQLGYEDLNDHDRLRHDPALALMAGKPDIEGLGRIHEGDEGKALAAHSTLNRLELSAEGIDLRYKKIQPQTDKIEALLIAEAVKAIPGKSKQIVLDFDATEDPLHGNQEGRFYHGYYGHYCYLPLYCFCGNIPLLAQLRSSGIDACEGTVEALEKIVPQIRKRFGRKVEIVLRGDGGFAREAIMHWCEQNKVFYCLGLARNRRLQHQLKEQFEQLESAIESGELSAPVRRFHQFEYRTLDSWSRKRRVLGKAEILERGANPRFIVTNFTAKQFAPRELYEDFYCARGDMENRIKEQQQDLFADRTSTRSMATNQLRLWFCAFAHLIMAQMQKKLLKGTRLEKATIGTIRRLLFKIAGRIKISCRRIHLELPSACLYRQDFATVWKNLQAWPS